MGNGSYAQQYQEYFNDQFVFRDSWIKLKTGFDRLLGKVEENGVYIGKSGYLIEKFDRPQQSVVNQTLKAMEKFQKSYKDIHHYVMIVPTASEIFKGQASGFGSDSGSGFLYRSGIPDTDRGRIDDSGRRKYVSEKHGTAAIL